MKSLKYYISSLLLAGVVGMGFTSCSDDKLDPNSIFPKIDETLDPNSKTYKLDKFLRDNYLTPYNLDFRYKMQDVGTNMNYNLVPATYDNAVDLAVLTKYLWFEAYEKVAGPDFLKLYGPRIIHLIGSPAYNPTSGTMILGLAEGGIKVSLFRVNSMNIKDFNQMNEYYFKTMHHEFAHILHQTKTYPSEFNTLSVGKYDSNNWGDRQEGVVASWGFVSTYASSEFREDFAEVIANYIVKTDKQWAHLLDMASRGWETPSSEDEMGAIYYCYYYFKNNSGDEADKIYVDEFDVQVNEDGTKQLKKGKDPEGNPIVVYDVVDKDGIDGVEVINKKVQIARQWLADEWGVNLDKLREEVQDRQQNYNIENLRDQVRNIK